MLLCASSPYARRGELWRAYQEHYGKDGAPLVWQADTRTMNPSVPQSFIDEEMQRDPASAAAEYGAQFRTDVESYIPLEAVRACIETGVRERLPLRQWRYVAFTDPSGGSADSMTLAVAHKEGDTAILDLLREVRPPFSPEAVVEEFADVLRRYRLTKVYGDRYAGEWCREVFLPARAELRDRREAQVRPVSGPVAAHQFPRRRSAGERAPCGCSSCSWSVGRRAAGGTIDHPSGGHDDVANAAAGALVTAAKAAVRRPCAANHQSELQPLQPAPATVERLMTSHRADRQSCNAERARSFPSYTRATHTCPTAKTLNARGIRTAREGPMAHVYR